MKIFNNKLANITTFVFWDKVDYFDFSHVIKKETIYMFCASLCDEADYFNLNHIFKKVAFIYVLFFFCISGSVCDYSYRS